MKVNDYVSPSIRLPELWRITAAKVGWMSLLFVSDLSAIAICCRHRAHGSNAIPIARGCLPHIGASVAYISLVALCDI